MQDPALRVQSREDLKVDSITFENQSIPPKMRDALRGLWKRVKSRLPDSATLTLLTEPTLDGKVRVLTRIAWREQDGIQRDLEDSVQDYSVGIVRLVGHIETRIAGRAKQRGHHGK